MADFNTIKPRAGAFKRWSKVVVSTLGVLLITTALCFPLSQQHNKYEEAVRGLESRLLREKVEAEEAACQCKLDRYDIAFAGVLTPAESERFAFEAQELPSAWARRFGPAGDLFRLCVVLAVSLFVLWLLTALVRFVWIGGK